jgi:hypothetical protein
METVEVVMEEGGIGARTLEQFLSCDHPAALMAIGAAALLSAF